MCIFFSITVVNTLGISKHDMKNRFPESLNIKPLTPDDNIPYELLLLGDEDLSAINKYIHHSQLYVCLLDARVIAVCALQALSNDTVEIKNLAVDHDFQGTGIGTYFLQWISDEAARRDFKSLLIGTGDQADKQLRLYRKAGFVDFKIRENFFTDNYPRPIYENGLQLKDMIVLKKSI